jgi:hypothetical protein
MPYCNLQCRIAIYDLLQSKWSNSLALHYGKAMVCLDGNNAATTERDTKHEAKQAKYGNRGVGRKLHGL